MQLHLVVVEQDGGQVLHRVLACDIHLKVDVAEGIRQAGHLRKRGDHHVLGSHRYAAGVIRYLFAGDERGGNVRLAHHVIHAHQ